jgi:beta-mannosidase
LANKLIPDPYFDLNQLLMYQLEDKDWEYSTHFTVPANILSKNIQNLIFEGVDTHADIYLNE